MSLEVLQAYLPLWRAAGGDVTRLLTVLRPDAPVNVIRYLQALGADVNVALRGRVKQ